MTDCIYFKKKNLFEKLWVNSARPATQLTHLKITRFDLQPDWPANPIDPTRPFCHVYPHIGLSLQTLHYTKSSHLTQIIFWFVTGTCTPRWSIWENWEEFLLVVCQTWGGKLWLVGLKVFTFKNRWEVYIFLKFGFIGNLFDFFFE